MAPMTTRFSCPECQALFLALPADGEEGVVCPLCGSMTSAEALADSRTPEARAEARVRWLAGLNVPCGLLLLAMGLCLAAIAEWAAHEASELRYYDAFPPHLGEGAASAGLALLGAGIAHCAAAVLLLIGRAWARRWALAASVMGMLWTVTGVLLLVLLCRAPLCECTPVVLVPLGVAVCTVRTVRGRGVRAVLADEGAVSQRQ